MTLLWFSSFHLNAQFLGGSSDGYTHGSVNSILNQQDIYCSGGYGQGFSTDTSSHQTINIQDLYCSGGQGDGYESDMTTQITQNNQVFYCSGGIGNGYGLKTSAPIIQTDQSLYCIGGDGDGFSMETTGIVATSNQVFYCNGGIGDGYVNATTGLVIQYDQSFYCSSGDGEGFDFESYGPVVQFNQSFYCNGGDGDGYFLKSSGISTPNDATFYCSGGIADGYGLSFLMDVINDQSIYCSSDSSDGYSMEYLQTTINQHNFYCFGGNGDGYYMENHFGSVFGSNFFCQGGDGDGYVFAGSSTLSLGIGIWKGLSSTDWNTPTNWAHSTVPAYLNDVYIPAGCSYYPNITGSLGINGFGNTRCHGLMIEPGASLDHSGYLFIKGEMRVEGNYINTFNNARSQIIFTNGLLHILATGVVKLGNQSSGTGLVDLVINNEGTLYVEGGTIEIDDQLHIGTGGTFNMTAGEVFIHKHGEGSTLSSDNPYNFWVKVGAMGELSGGTVYVSGRETVGDFGAVLISEDDFLFNGTNTLVFQNGDNPVHFDPAIYFPNGGSLQNMTINKPGNTVFIKTNLDVKGELKVQSGSSLEVENGCQVSVGQ